MNPSFLRPDWVMLGVPDDDGGFWVFASDQLTRAELEMVIDDPDHFTGGFLDPLTPSNRRFDLHATAYTIVAARGDTYADAVRNLFTHWTPDTEDRSAIGGQRVLVGGSTESEAIGEGGRRG